MCSLRLARLFPIRDPGNELLPCSRLGSSTQPEHQQRIDLPNDLTTPPPPLQSIRIIAMLSSHTRQPNKITFMFMQAT